MQVDKIVLRTREGSILIDSRIYIHLHMCIYHYFLHVDNCVYFVSKFHYLSGQ